MFDCIEVVGLYLRVLGCMVGFGEMVKVFVYVGLGDILVRFGGVLVFF